MVGGPVAAKGAVHHSTNGQHPTEDMCPGVDTALRSCQGAAVNRVSLGRRLPSPAVRPGEAVSQLPCLGLPLVFQASEVEPTNANTISLSAASSPTTSPSRSETRVGKGGITLETAATPQRVEADL